MGKNILSIFFSLMIKRSWDELEELEEFFEINRVFLFCNRVFHSLYKVGRNGNFVFKGFNNSKKNVTSNGARPDATDYYWFRSPVPNHMS